jgi:plasmid maintenance system antidote protein VapI
MNVNKLKGKIVEKGMNIEALAANIGINRASLYRKLNDAEKITIGEAAKMKNALEMTDDEAYEIFLA